MLIIEVTKKNIDFAIKQFKSKVMKTKLISKLQDKKRHKKKSDVNRQIIKDAIYREKKKLED